MPPFPTNSSGSKIRFIKFSLIWNIWLFHDFYFRVDRMFCIASVLLAFTKYRTILASEIQYLFFTSSP